MLLYDITSRGKGTNWLSTFITALPLITDFFCFYQINGNGL